MDKRLGTLDSVRGITLISMILYHFCWDLKFIAGFDMPWYSSYGAFLWQQSICWTFIILSGFCMGLSKRPLKRGIIISLAGIIITAVTFFVMGDEAVIFGVLTLIGAAMIITALMENVLSRIPPEIGLAAALILFAVTRYLKDGYIGLFRLRLMDIPVFLYRNYLTAFIGLPQAFFRSSDYFPLIPWIFLFWAGYFLFGIIRKRALLKRGSKWPEAFYINIPGAAFMGRHSLEIYMLHQAVLYGITQIIMMIK